MAKDDYAVVIGIRTYPLMGSLEGPCLDAQEFHEWLLDPDGGDVPDENAQLLITDSFHDPDETEHPLADEIHVLFKDFVQHGHIAHTSGPIFGRRLYIYMAGHGFSEIGDGTQAALCAANASPSFAFNVAGTKYAEWFRRNAVFNEIVLVMDCCRTTSLVSEITSPPLPRTGGSPNSKKVRTFYAYAVADGQPAREQKTNGKVRGIFTAAFLEALKNAEGDAQGRVRGEHISAYVHNQIGALQAPDFDVKAKRDVVLLENRAAGLFEVALKLAPFAGGEVIELQDGNKKPIDTISPASETVILKLKTGLYKVLVAGTGRSQLFEVPVEDEIVV
jgi:uncharacterized caspase-like protein